MKRKKEVSMAKEIHTYKVEYVRKHEWMCRDAYLNVMKTFIYMLLRKGTFFYTPSNFFFLRDTHSSMSFFCVHF